MKPNQILTGFVSAIKDYGIFVEFYNHIYGLVSINELKKNGDLSEDQTPQSLYQKGAIVKVRVTYVQPLRTRAALSFNLTPSLADTKDNTLIPGTLTSAIVSKIHADKLEVTLPKFENIMATLPLQHLTDHTSLAEALLQTYPVGTKIKRCLILYVDTQTKSPVLSIKSSFLEAAKRQNLSPLVAASSEETSSDVVLPDSMEQVHEGALLLGYVRNIVDYGVFINFLDYFSGLAPRGMLSDLFVTDISSVYQLGQTIKCKVISKEPEKNQMTLSLKPSICKDTWEEEGKFIASYFTDKDRIIQYIFNVSAKEHPSFTSMEYYIYCWNCITC